MIESETNPKKPEQPNFSSDRDDAIQELLDAIPLIKNTPFYISPIFISHSKLKEIDSYTTIHGSRALGALVTDQRMDIAAAALIKPIVVFRDFLKALDGRESTILEYYLSRVRLNTGKEPFVLVVVRRNVIAKVSLSYVPEDLVGLMNGLQFYKAY